MSSSIGRSRASRPSQVRHPFPANTYPYVGPKSENDVYVALPRSVRESIASQPRVSRGKFPRKTRQFKKTLLSPPHWHHSCMTSNRCADNRHKRNQVAPGGFVVDFECASARNQDVGGSGCQGCGTKGSPVEAKAKAGEPNSPPSPTVFTHKPFSPLFIVSRFQIHSIRLHFTSHSPLSNHCLTFDTRVVFNQPGRTQCKIKHSTPTFEIPRD
jgi:hypothetical protein